MAAARWYPTVTPLRNGEMLITEGGPDMPEVRTTTRRPAGAQQRLAQPAAVPVDGRRAGRPRVLLGAGPDDAQRSSTDGSGAWQTYGAARHTSTADYGSHALYDVGKILVAGGGASSRDARVIDINGATPQVSRDGRRWPSGAASTT